MSLAAGGRGGSGNPTAAAEARRAASSSKAATGRSTPASPVASRRAPGPQRQPRLADARRRTRLPVGRAAFLRDYLRALAGPVPADGGRSADAGIATWVDGAHNIEAAAALCRAPRRSRPDAHCPRDPRQQGRRDRRGACAACACRYVRAGFRSRAPRPADACRALRRTCRRFAGEALATLPAPRLIAGSLYLAGEALAAQRADARLGRIPLSRTCGIRCRHRPSGKPPLLPRRRASIRGRRRRPRSGLSAR